MTAILASEFQEVEASDTHEDLIMLWESLKEGWQPPNIISEKQYNKIRTASPSALRGFVGFGVASWGGKWFGGYARGGARNYADESRRSLLRDIQKMKNVVFYCRDYRSIEVASDDVVYADPPYSNTTGYGGSFDSTGFWNTMASWIEVGAHVFVSEYVAPVPWFPIFEVTRTRDMKSRLTNAEQVTEKLFTMRDSF